MKTIRILHANAASERVEVVCEHGVRFLTSTTDTDEALDFVVRMVLREHTAEVACDCQMDAIEDIWLRWEDARGLFNADQAPDKVPPGGEPELHALITRLLNTKGGCDTCDPGMLLRFSKAGLPDMAVLHRSPCPKRGQPGKSSVETVWGSSFTGSIS